MHSATARLAAGLLPLFAGTLLVGCERPGSVTEPGPEAGAAGNASPRATANRELAGVRRATSRYNDLRKATADGYTQFSIHVPGMGIHYLTSDAVGAAGASSLDASLDRTDPEILVYVEDAAASQQRRLVAVEYAVPKTRAAPPAEAVNLFSAAGAGDWHVHPSVHELPLPDTWTVHGECHYVGGLGLFLAENPSGDFVIWTPANGGTVVGSWSGTVAADQCPPTLAGQGLLVAHGKWWTLHAWVWYPNPEGVFHPTNPRVSP